MSDRQQFNEWLNEKNAYVSFVEWCAQHPDLSVQELIDSCPKGQWLLWMYAKAGYAAELLAPVAYRAATRAMGYAPDTLDRAGVQHGLRDLVITDRESARDALAAAWAAADAARAAAWAAADAARAAANASAWAAWAADAAWAAAWAAEAAWAADAAARDAAWAAWAADAAARAAWAAVRDAATEHKTCADDCRELLPMWEVGNERSV